MLCANQPPLTDEVNSVNHGLLNVFYCIFDIPVTLLLTPPAFHNLFFNCSYELRDL